MRVRIGKSARRLDMPTKWVAPQFKAITLTSRGVQILRLFRILDLSADFTSTTRPPNDGHQVWARYHGNLDDIGVPGETALRPLTQLQEGRIGLCQSAQYAEPTWAASPLKCVTGP